MGVKYSIGNEKDKVMLIESIINCKQEWYFQSILGYNYRLDYSLRYNFENAMKTFINDLDKRNRLPNDMYKKSEYTDLFKNINVITIMFLLNTNLFQSAINKKNKQFINYDVVCKFLRSEFALRCDFSYTNFNIIEEICQLYKNKDQRLLNCPEFNLFLQEIKTFQGFSPVIQYFRKGFVDHKLIKLSKSVYSQQYHSEKAEFYEQLKREKEIQDFVNAFVRHRRNYG